MNLKQALEKGFIKEIKVPKFFITCQKCSKSWEIRYPKKIPTVCTFCKKDPYTDKNPVGRPPGN